ncbi:hypothetical protein WSK_2861 [Novosphingobium sp. Rr 2-17]|uniref:hypothetical protein n=1 Tax=Novosphingobium sp. Rr 2-17 TaxID=555793 RepID=UPI0002699BD6|nr:hypothetical protein [Novosphingobium sp. Rr 2-17]EIZ78813.1 hypothetical protein WSK_2861 [Novosphingobium sp. Rr 2-17]
MSTTLNASFTTRRDAEMTVERLVQEYAIERTDIFVSAQGDDNTAGDHPAGSDTPAATPGTDGRDDAALNGRIVVSVDVRDEAAAADIRTAFAEFSGASGAAD